MTVKNSYTEIISQEAIGYIFSEDDLKNKSLNKWMNTPIYRIIPVSRFIQILTSKELTLVKPKKWDDPFENALLSSDFTIGTETADFAARDSVYGQCWTLHTQTDAMWRIYSQGKDGVRLKTTPKKLLEALKSHVGKLANITCFIGKVQYHPRSELISVFSQIELLKSDGSGIAKSLLHKRREFSHEAEVRLIYIGSDDFPDIFSFIIEPNKLFDQILFDPRMEEPLRKSYISAIGALGSKVNVARSTLYDPPPGWKFNLDS